MADGAKVRTVAEVMTKDVLTASASDDLSKASARMIERGVGSIIVRDPGQPVGILTERDLVRAGASGADLSNAKVSDWMTAEADTIAPDLTVQAALDSLNQHGYRHFPVVKDGELVGVVSIRDIFKLGQVLTIEHPGAIEAKRGLEGVVVAETEVGDVRGQEGFYHYREYNAVELAEKRTLEDVWHLLYQGHLPSAEERESFAAEILCAPQHPAVGQGPAPGHRHRRRALHPPRRPAHRLLAVRVRARLQVLARHQPRGAPGQRHADQRGHADADHGAVPPQPGPRADRPPPRAGVRGQLPVHAHRRGPRAGHARAIEQYLISTTDHGFNSSTFTARVITSTGADLGSAVVGAIGALSGPLHGGAPSRALDMLDAIGTPDKAEAWIRDSVMKGERIMGFGHRIYKTDDPRSLMLRDVASAWAATWSSSPRRSRRPSSTCWPS